MKNRVKNYLSVVLSLFLITACSSGNPTTPSKPNIPNLTKAQSSVGENEVKKINLNGKVIDSITRKPIEHATILVYAVSNTDIINNVKNGVKSDIKPSGAPSAPAESSSAPGATPSPVSSISPPIPDIQTSPDANPVPAIEENEEKTQPKPKVNSPLPRKLASSPVPPKINIKTSPGNAPSDSPIPSPSEKPKDENEITAPDIVSELTKLKSNDFQEFTTTTGNDGKFWINKVPDTNIIITINAPNYKTVSVFNSDTSKVEDIALEPLDSKEYFSVISGEVLAATNNPAENAVVTSSYVIGESFSIPTNTNDKGEFKLEDISIGERTLIATLKDDNGKIISMGTLDYEIKKDKNSYVQKKNQPEKKVTKNSDKKDSEKEQETIKSPDENSSKKTSENEEETKKSEPTESKDSSLKDDKKKEEVKETTKAIPAKNEKKEEKDKNIPVIKLKSVTEYINLKGKITLPEDTTLQTINVYSAFKKKGLPKEEFFLTDKQILENADSFDLELPKPDSGYYYHLEFVAKSKKGSFVYHHEYNIKKENKEMKVGFIAPLNIGKVDFLDKDGEKLPIFTWLPVEGAGFYKVTLDKVDKDNNVVSIWTGITPFSTAIYPITTGSNKLSPEYSYLWSVSAIKEGSDKSSADKLQFSKLNILSWSDLANSPSMEFNLSNVSKEIEEIEEIDKDKKEEKN